ncbi:hypothetical protein SPRG_20980 [Saprolegnia parasitica CBS 223.65]|uniref:Uncharacterized protein n=1 Tax=Saprolegnia parasitica (strain CBS 223.65) TaxID=695850 RepID=A0A067BXJ8_SAPPC|nr:hypothetical protein SPRG_20980 [Saprolegnia parasitica CBS 223.65]KDO23224.1 hypothetical protein SPRG_20980 [Saprolegnia parasitica CBS 223.65]|eukprot:XP_012206069.1 hypothetical protein SPRG_20980 [Saprolegnia parasitica CBS 223.65]
MYYDRLYKRLRGRRFDFGLRRVGAERDGRRFVREPVEHALGNGLRRDRVETHGRVDRHFRKLFFKVGGIRVVLLGIRVERRLGPEKAVPVDAREERMRLDVGGAMALQATEPLVRVAVQKRADERRRFVADIVRDLERRIADAGVEVLTIPRIPRRHAGEHLKEHHAEAPPVDGGAMALAREDFGC